MRREGERNREDGLPRVEVAIELGARGVRSARITVFAVPDGDRVLNEPHIATTARGVGTRVERALELVQRC